MKNVLVIDFPAQTISVYSVGFAIFAPPATSHLYEQGFDTLKAVVAANPTGDRQAHLQGYVSQGYTVLDNRVQPESGTTGVIASNGSSTVGLHDDISTMFAPVDSRMYFNAFDLFREQLAANTSLAFDEMLTNLDNGDYTVTDFR